MIINKVTFTGADDNTDIKLMQQIQKEFSFVEWGILISSNSGRNRYPSEDFILNLKDKKLNLALHICGKHSRNIMSDGIIDIKYDFFNRYQINFNFLHTPHNLENYKKLVTTFPDKKFILQYNLSNDLAIKTILSMVETHNTNILYDSSGGRGTELKSIKGPYSGIYTGYSGGLNPTNIDDICSKLWNHENDSNVWIDMETGVRTDDIFDLDKVYSVLQKVDKWIHKTKSIF